MLRSRLSTTDLFEVLGCRQVGCQIEGAPGAAPSGGGPSSPAAGSQSPAPSGGAPVSGGGTVAPGVEPPPGAPGSTVPSTTVPASEPPDFMSIFDGPPVEVVSPPAPPAAPVEPAAPAQPVTPAVVAPPAVPAVAGPGEGGQPTGTPPVSGPSPVLDPYDPSGLAIAIQQNEQATIDYVAQSMFALTQEDLQALEADVGGTVPKLLAKAFVKTQVNSLMQLARIIPEMVRRSTENMRNHTQNEDSFYQAWPQIDRTKHADIVKRYGITYRTMNPGVSKEQMIADLGPLVMMAARIPTTATPTVPTQPAQNGRVAPAAHQPSPFSPAISGPAATVTAPELSDVEAMFAPRD